ncbi:MAG: RecB-family nuclease [Thermofilum sp.]|jgi:SpoU rRNA methylase family enzyme|nr:RecB-family nuclease [Thermofilum sp.]
MLDRFIPVLHNTNSSQRVAETARIAFGLGYKTLVISKAVGPAAQIGLPEAQKLALRYNANVIFLADLPEVLDLLQPEITLVVVPGKYGGVKLSEALARIFPSLKDRKKILLVFGGSEPGLTQREMKIGETVHPDGITEDIGAVGVVAVTLYTLMREVQAKQV